jgi:hypothetical protein
MEELWVPLKQSLVHEVSSFGRVRSLDHEITMNSRWGKPCRKKVKGKLLKPFFCGKYLSIRFRMGGLNYYIHRLVAEHFLSGDTSLQVNHKDGIKTNNFLENLEFVTASENCWHSTYVLNNRKGQFSKGGIRIVS